MHNIASCFRAVLALTLAALLVAGCTASPTAAPATPGAPSTAAATTAPTAAPTAAPTEVPPTPVPTAVPSPTPVPAPAVWLDNFLESSLRASLEGIIDGDAVSLVQEPAGADVRVGPELAEAIGTWVYAVVVPFPTLPDEVSMEAIRAFWGGDASAMLPLSEDDEPPTLLLTAETHAALRSRLGEPSAEALIELLPVEELIEVAWARRPHAWSIVPFDALQPRWKVLRVDGLDVLDKALDVTTYPLTVAIGVEGERAAEVLPPDTALTNRDTDKMTTLVMTGVTAMVRAMAHEMETRGLLFPAQDIGETLAAADITHVSNEIPFYTNCPPVNRNQESLVFCSDPSYIELLRASGADIIELTGNHFQDYGDDATLETLAMYNEEGWPYYGGGADIADATRPALLEHNGNTFSFIGCNPVGPEYAWATETQPGAAPCNWDDMHATLNGLRETVDVPVATFQYWEFYFYEPTPQQQVDFRGMADAGARIVSGSQAHHPQAIEFYNGAFIHYGLGNLYFDQMWSLGTRQEMVDRHVIYDGRHLSTQLLTYMLEDYARPRPMTDAERRQLLTSVFTASGW